MAQFTQQDMNTYSARTREWMNQMWQMYQDGGEIIDVYLNQTAAGTDPNFTDTPIASKAEHQEAVNVMNRIRDCLAFDGQNVVINPEDQTARFTPFLQS